MPQSALRALDQAYMMGMGQGPAPVRVPKTRGQTTADVLGAASIPMSAIPIAGDITGLAADAAMYAAYPEERTFGNYALSALGALPMVPGAAAVKAARASSPLEGTLDMSTEARMQRAAEEGFDVDMPVYHGTRSDVQEFSVQDQVRNRKSNAPPGVFFFSSSPEIAGSYSAASRSKAGAANIIPAYLRMKNPLVIDAKGNPWSQIELTNDFMSRIDPRRYPPAQNKLPDGSGMDRMLMFSTNDLAEIARKSGNYDGMVIKNVYDPGTLRTKEVSDTYAVFDPSSIRSVNAAFDPAKRGSSNLMAGAAGGAIGLSALRGLQSDEQERKPD